MDNFDVTMPNDQQTIDAIGQVIHGGRGSGRTTYALRMAVQQAREGKIVFFISTNVSSIVREPHPVLVEASCGGASVHNLRSWYQWPNGGRIEFYRMGENGLRTRLEMLRFGYDRDKIVDIYDHHVIDSWKHDFDARMAELLREKRRLDSAIEKYAEWNAFHEETSSGGIVNLWL